MLEFAVIVPFANAHTERRLFQSNIFKMDPQVNIVQICPWDNFKCFLKLNLDQDYSKNTFLAKPLYTSQHSENWFTKSELKVTGWKIVF